MPRKGAKGKWDLKMSPDEWYFSPDPWKVENNQHEQLKADLISGLVDGFNILDIGCGEGHFTNRYKTHDSRVTGIDISHIAIGRARRLYGKDISFIRYDISKSSYWTPMDAVILSEVLYYIKPSLWETVSENIKKTIQKREQFIISVGQYFTEADIRKIFPWCEFDKVFKLPSEKYEYNLIMSGRKK